MGLKRLAGAAQAVIAAAFVLAPLTGQGEYRIGAATLYYYSSFSAAYLAPYAAGGIGAMSGLCGLLWPHSRAASSVRTAGVVLTVLLIILTYLQAREHIVIFSSVCVAGVSARPDPSAPILPTFTWWTALAVNVALCTPLIRAAWRDR